MSLSGTRVGHFKIGKSIGLGAIGEVYAGYNEALQKEVALKALKVERRLSRKARARFLREARILSHLDHPNICRIHDYIEGDEADLLVLELIEGRDLPSAIQAGLDRATKLRIAEQIASVLVEAHAAGVVHRDLKPGNVMLTVRDQVKVLDFGLARDVPVSLETRGRPETTAPRREVGTEKTIIEEPESPSTPVTMDSLEMRAGIQTADGSVLGTPTYMSPEQARGEPSTTASDMYSFGLLLQVLLTGRTPYDEDLDTLSLLKLAMRAETSPVEGLDADLTRLIDDLKSLAPAQRPTALETATRLRRIRDKPRRRLRGIAVAVAAALVLMAGVKYTADLSRERGIARQREAQAVELLDFMLGDLRHKLEPLGKLELLDDVGIEALQFFESLQAGRRMTDAELFSYTKLMSQIGQVRMGLGEYSEAREAFEESIALADTLVERDSGNGAWQRSLGEAHFWIGQMHYERGELEDALARFREYQRIIVELAAREPTSQEWRLERAYTHTNIGSVLELQGDLDGAVGEYGAALVLKQELADASPDDAERLGSLATTHEDLGTLFQAQGRFDGAGRHLTKSVAIRRALFTRAPDDLLRLENLGIGLHLLGDLLGKRGDRERALELLDEDLAIARRLAANDPTNVYWQRGLAMSLGMVGEMLAFFDFERARAHFDESSRLLRALAGQSPDQYQLRRDLAAVQFASGRALERQRLFDLALRDAAEARDALLTIVAGHPQDRRARHTLVRVHLLDGRLAEREGSGERARRAWTAALELVEPIARDSADVGLARLWAEALLRLDRLDEAAVIVARLGALEYRDADLDRLCEAKGVSNGFEQGGAG